MRPTPSSPKAGVVPELTSAFGFQQRVVQAELAYRKGALAPVHDQNIVTAVNNLALSVNAPLWARTSVTEVRRLRLLALPLFPQMLMNHATDAAQKHQILSPDLSPLEATHVAILLIHQKLRNVNYQFTPDEVKANPTMATIRSLHKQCSAELEATMSGAANGKSLRDMLHSADNFFNDLGLAPVMEVAQ